MNVSTILLFDWMELEIKLTAAAAANIHQDKLRLWQYIVTMTIQIIALEARIYSTNKTTCRLF